MKNFIFSLIIITGLFFQTGCSGTISNTTESANLKESGAESTVADPAAGDTLKVQPVKVVKGVDGDTIKASLDGRDESVRLIGVNTPELSHPGLNIKEQPFGKEAAKYTTDMLLNKTVYLQFDVGQRDKYGRLLAYVWLQKPTSGREDDVRKNMFNAQLLISGYAQVMTVPPNVQYQDIFVRLEQEARQSNKGFWGISEEKPNDRYNK